MKWSIYYNIWSFECIIFYGDLEPKPVPGIWAATITSIQINSACCKGKWADCDPEEQKKKQSTSYAVRSIGLPPSKKQGKNPLHTGSKGSLLLSSGPAENLRLANKHRTLLK
jgi:hypothetical protein